MTYPPFWFAAVKDFHKTKTLSFLLTSLLVVALYVFSIVYIEQEIFHIDFKPNSTIFSLLGLVLGLLLVFRTNTAYDRWWEGRKLWGDLTNNARDFALKLNAILPLEDNANRIFFRKIISAYSYALKNHLTSKHSDWDLFDKQLEGATKQVDKQKHVPNQTT